MVLNEMPKLQWTRFMREKNVNNVYTNKNQYATFAGVYFLLKSKYSHTIFHFYAYTSTSYLFAKQSKNYCTTGKKTQEIRTTSVNSLKNIV